MFFNWLSSDKDDSQSIENTTNIQSSQSGNDDTIENTSDLVELQNCSKITFGDDETNKDDYRAVNNTNDLNDLQNGANESIDDDDDDDDDAAAAADDDDDDNVIQKTKQQNKIVETVKSIASKFSKKLEFKITDSCITTKTNDFNVLFQFVLQVSIILGLQFKESTITKYKDMLSKNCFFRCCDIGHSHQDRFCCLKLSKVMNSNYVKYIILLTFSKNHTTDFTKKYAIYTVRRNTIKNKLKELESLLFNKIEMEAEKFQIVRIKKNKASKICKQRKKKREFLRKASEVLPGISRDIENGVIAVDENAKKEFENNIRIANQYNIFDQ